MLIRLLALLCVAGLAFGYSPQPKSVTPGEAALEAALEAAASDEAQVALAREYLEKYPDDIPMGRTAQSILNKKSETAPDWYKARMDANPTSTNRYLWARAMNDPKISVEQADWIMENEPENFWGYYLKASALWTADEPDMDKVIDYYEQAVTKDPGRYEGYLWLGYAYEEAGKAEQALEVFKAAQVVDPADKYPRMSMLGLYAQLRNADEYFKLVDSLLPKEPVTEKLAVAQAEPEAPPVGFNGDFTVFECFAHW